MSIEAQTDLVLRTDQKFFDGKQVAALKAMGVAPDTSNADLAVFFHQARRTGLDPFAKQIYLMQRRSMNQQTKNWETKSTIQTGIDGYRLIARKAATKQNTDYDYGPVEWCDSEGKWSDVWLHPGEAPIAARVTLYVGEKNKQYPAIAHYSEYVQTTRDGSPNSMWVKMAASQLAKCAEALALRKAFPLDLSGIYTDDEMQQAGQDLEDMGEQMSGEPAAEAPKVKVSRQPRAKAASAKPEPTSPEPESHAPTAAPEEQPTEDESAAPLLEEAPTTPEADPSTPDPEDPAQPPADYGTPAVLEDLGENREESEPAKEKAPAFKACTPGSFRKVGELAAAVYEDPTQRRDALLAWFRDYRQAPDLGSLPQPAEVSREEADALTKHLQALSEGMLPTAAG